MPPTEPKAVKILKELLDSDNEMIRLRAASELLRWERADEPPTQPATGATAVALPDLPDGWDE